MSKKENIFIVLIWLLSVLLTFFATRNYRNENVLQLVSQVNQYQLVFSRTNDILKTIAWSDSGKTWEQLGYTINKNKTNK